MRIKSLILSNFRGYEKECRVDFESFTAFIGRNDIGKSTILEALDIFFNDGKGTIKIDKEDINKKCSANGNTDICLSLVLDSLPPKIILDEAYETTLENEYLLNGEGCLEIKKVFKNGASPKVFINAFHPSNPECCNLLSKKQKDLKTQVETIGAECEDKRVNAKLRSAIWSKFSEDNSLQLQETLIDVSTKDGDIKPLWEKLQNYMPFFSLFQSDRKNTDADEEVQDPMSIAVKQIMSSNEIQSHLDDVATKVRAKLEDVINLTLAKIKEMNPSVADSLSPKIPKTNELKWNDVFKKVSITGDKDIPINKRGSGVKRLILLNFFRAEAERRLQERDGQHIIYAVEEPETSQHKHHQRLLVTALKSLSSQSKAQVIITTHSADIVKQLFFEQLRLVIEDEQENKMVKKVERQTLPYPSLNEVNYLAFGEVSEEYHNELYGYLQARAIDENSDNEKEKCFDQWLCSKGLPQDKQWIRVQGGTAKPAVAATLSTYIRNLIHHPENNHNSIYTEEELEKSINAMKIIAANYL